MTRIDEILGGSYATAEPSRIDEIIEPSKGGLLQQNAQTKLNNLKYKKDTLLGMHDADTLVTQNLGSTRSVDPMGQRYDAVELQHGNMPYDMYGISKEQRDAGQIGKSTYAMDMQREQVARAMGKNVQDVTQQDMIDVGNMQQIQKLADLARSPGEERWIAPLIKDAVQTNLTGKYEVDGQVQEIPLNVPIQSAQSQDIGERAGASFATEAGEDVTGMTARDAELNAFANPQQDYKSSNYVDVLKSIESRGGDYGLVNEKSGAMGAYQFMPTTLEMLKKKTGEEFTNEEFLANPALQDKYFGLLNQENERVLGAMRLDATPMNMWMAHNLGPAQAKNINDVLEGKAQPTERTLDYIERNLPKGVEPTVANYVKLYGDKFGQANGGVAEQKSLADYMRDAEGSSLGNAARGFGYTLGEGIINTIDLVPELIEYAATDKDWKDVEGLYGKEEAEKFKEWTGYNEEVLNNLGQEAKDAVAIAMKEGDVTEALKVIGKGITTPELAATSMGFVLSMMLPGTAGTKILRASKGVDKTAKALMERTPGLSKAEAIVKAEERMMKAGKLDVGYKIAKAMTDNAGYIGYAEQFGRDAEELYQETYGEEMPTWQRIAARPLGMLYGKLDAGIAKAIVLGKDPIAKAMPDMIKALPDQMKATLLGKIAVLSGASAGRVAGAMGVEGLTEMIQTSMEKVAGQYKEGEVGVVDVLAQNVEEIGGAGLLGAAGGAQFTAPTTAVGAVTALGSEIATEAAQKEVEEVSSKVEADIAAGLEGKVENPLETARGLRMQKEAELGKIQKIDKDTGRLTGEYTEEFKQELKEGKTDKIDSTIEWLENYQAEVVGSKEEVDATQMIIDELKDTRDGILAYKEGNIQPTVDAVKESIDNQPDIEATVDEKVAMAFADMYDEKGGLTDEAIRQGWTEESIDKVKKATKAQYRVAGFGPLEGDLQIELDENVLGFRQDKAKLKEGETAVKRQGVKTRDVNIDVVSDEDISGLLSADFDKIGESINNIAGAVKGVNTKIKKRVLDTLGIESFGSVGSKVRPLLELGDRVTNSVSTAMANEDTVKRIGKVFKGENVAGNLKRLLVLAMAEIDASTVTNTKELQGITAKESNFRPDEYWASRSQLVEEIGKRYETSYGLKLKGSPKKLREHRRKLGELALRVLEEGGMIEVTKGEDPVRLFKLSDEAMVEENGKKVRASSVKKAGKLDLKSGRIEAYDQDVKLYPDQGVRLLNEKGLEPVDSKGYKNDLGDVAKRLTKVLLPSQSMDIRNEAPDNNFVADPVKVDDKISAFTPDKNTMEGSVEQTIRDLEKEPLHIKEPMANLITEIRALRDSAKGDLWAVFKKNKSLAKAVGWMDTKVALLQDTRDGVNNQIVDDWNHILDAFENIVDEDGNPRPMYYKYQYDVNSRITLMNTVLNFQGFKDSRYMLSKEKPVKYEDNSEAEKKLVYHVLEELGVMGKKPSKEQYDEARNLLKGEDVKDGVLTQEQVNGINKYKKLADKVASFEGTELQKLEMVANEVGSKVFKKLALINAIADIQNMKDGIIETDFMAEYDAKASGVTNTLLALMHIPEIQEILKSFGLRLGKDSTETEWQDAYRLLEDKVVGAVDAGKLEKLRELDEVLGMNTRELAKPVVMTWFYSAGETSISREFRIAIAQKLVEEAEAGNTGAKDMLERITGLRNPKEISESSDAYKAIMEYYKDVAKAYSDQIDTAYPSVREHKMQMTKWYEELVDLGMVEGEDLWQGKIPSAISYLRSGKLEIQDTGYIKLQKEKEVLLGTLSSLKDEVSSEEFGDTLVKQIESMANVTSLLPLLRQNVDGALLLESIDQLLKTARANKGIMTVHDAFYGSIEELEALKSIYDELSITLAKEYDDAGVMAAAAKYVVKQLEKAEADGKKLGKFQLQSAKQLAKNIDAQYQKNIEAKRRLGDMSISVLGVSEYEQAPAKAEKTDVKAEKQEPVKKAEPKKTEKKEKLTSTASIESTDFLELLDPNVEAMQELKERVAKDGKLKVGAVKDFLKGMSEERESTEILDALEAISNGKVEFIEEAEARKLAGKEFNENGFTTIGEDGKVRIYVNYQKALDRNTPKSMRELANVLYHEIEHARTLDWIAENEKSTTVSRLKKSIESMKDGIRKSSNRKLKYVVSEYEREAVRGVDELVALYREYDIHGRADLIRDIAELVGKAMGAAVKVDIEKIIREVRKSLEGGKMEGLNEVELEVAKIIAGIEYISKAKSKQNTGKIRLTKLYEQLKEECKG